jgi:hypothetical protein
MTGVPDSVRLRSQKTFFSDVRVRSLIEADMAAARKLLGPTAEVRRWVTAETIDSALAGPGAEARYSERSTWGFRLQHLAGTEMWLRSQSEPDFAAGLAAREGLEPARFEFVPQGPARA